MIERRRTRLHLFVSSPGDCAVERDLVETIVTDVNGSAAAQQAGIEIKVLRWENLPPGETEQLDYQGRIDDLLKRVGLERFEIYVGFMRARLGTPTRRYPSGTVDEFETALDRKRRGGLPAEVAFYFLGPPEAASAEVASFRSNLTSRGFLFSEAADANIFRSRLQEHLTHIINGWWQWKNRIRRSVRILKIAGIGFGVIALLAYVAADAATYVRLERLLRAEEYATAVTTWRANGPWLLASHWLTRQRIYGAAQSVAAARLMQSLLEEGVDPFTWKDEQLRPFEYSALSLYARQRLAEDPDLRRECDSACRRALVALAADWKAARQLATRAERAAEAQNPPEMRDFIVYAPASEVISWLNEDRYGIATYIAASILIDVKERNDFPVSIAALDAVRSDRLGKEARDIDPDFGCQIDLAKCAGMANALLVRWMRQPNKPPPAPLGALLTFADPRRISDEDWRAIEPSLLVLLSDKKFNDIESTLIESLARSPSAASRAELLSLVRRHSVGTISFGFRERAALLDALPTLQADAPDRIALRIAKRSAAEAAELLSTTYAPNDSIVQSAYLRLLAHLPRFHWGAHREWIRGLLDRRLSGKVPELEQADFDRAIAALLAQLDSASFLDLFEHLPAPLVDSINTRLSERRDYLLDLLTTTDQMLPLEIVAEVCRSVPALESHRASFYKALAVRGGQTGLQCLKSHLNSDPGAAEVIGLASDLDAVLSLLPATGPLHADRKLQVAVSAATQLNEDQRRRFTTLVFPRLSEGDLPSLWPMAGALKLTESRLVNSAVAELAQPTSAAKLVAAVDYLNSVDPQRVWNTLNQPDAAILFVALMKHVDPFDWDQIAQVLPDLKGDSSQRAISECLAARDVLIVLDASQVPPRDRISDRLMSARSKVVGNPLWRLVANRGGPASARLLLDSLQASAAPDILGDLPDRHTAYRAYLKWLLADVIASLDPEQRQLVPTAEIFDWISDSNPVSTRSSAGVALALLAPPSHGTATP
jgi:hypothetical protein